MTSTADLLQQQTAAAVAVGHTRPGSASLYARLVSVEPSNPLYTYSILLCVPWFRTHNLKTKNLQPGMYVSNRFSRSRCHHHYYYCMASTADLLPHLRPLISRRVGLTTPPAACLGDMARTLLRAGTVCLRVLVELDFVR